MEKIDIFRIDIFALRLLLLIDRLGSVSAAAEDIGMNQSSVSYTLERLRQAFHDPLFVRIGRRLEPTQRCRDIIPEIQALVTRYEQLTQPATFDPATSRERFVVSGNFYERAIIYPRLVHCLNDLAPHARLSIIQANTDGDRQLLQGESDVLISPLQTKSSGFYRRKMFDERYVCFVDPGSPFAQRGITLQEYANARHLQVTYANGWTPWYFGILAEHNVGIRASVEVPSFDAIERIVQGTDLIVTASSRLNDIYNGILVSIPAPFQSGFPVYMSWTSRTHASPSHRWLRGQIVRIVNELFRGHQG